MALNNGCSPSGPAVTLCIVDASNHGFQCADQKNKFFMPFEKSLSMVCASPFDTEEALKACKAGYILPITLCSLHLESIDFLCVEPSGNQKYIAISDADNYVCMNNEDRKRLLERCHH